MRTSRRPRFTWLAVILVLIMGSTACGGSTADPLPSWREGDARAAIMSFVERTTDEGSPDFVPVPQRIAVFDNDGCLWPENPIPFQLAFAVDEINRMVSAQPALKEDPMVAALLAGDTAKLLAGPRHEGLLRIIALTHAGMTTDEFSARVQDWIGTAEHPRFERPYDQLTYQPMQEVLRYLRANGFQTFIVSGGGADFMRAWSERVYGIPPEQVVGSTGRVTYELRDTGPVLVKTLTTCSSTTRPVSPRASTSSSAGARSSRSATAMATPRCSNTPRSTIRSPAWACSSITPTPSASTSTT